MRKTSSRSASVLVAASVLLTACQSADSKKPDPLSATASGELACNFVSKDSAAIAVGTKDFEVSGDRQDRRGTTNPDGSQLDLAGCTVNTKDVKEALTVDVLLVDSLPSADSYISEVLTSGNPSFVFPQAEGRGFAWSDDEHQWAADAQLIRGDWRYRVVVKNSSEGRNAVDDAVAILRQVVNQLGLPA